MKIIFASYILKNYVGYFNNIIKNNLQMKLKSILKYMLKYE